MEYNVAIISLGCPKNQVDSEVMMGLLKDSGFKLVSDQNEADIIVVNTCGFIEDAKQESIDVILEACSLKRTGRCKLLVAAGCLSQRYGKELMEEIPEIDAMVGTTSFTEIVNTIKKALRGSKEVRIWDPSVQIKEGLSKIQSTPVYTAYLKIADGCDNFCSYCIIPALRGRYRSRKEDEILSEAETLALKGTKELVLIAQDITRYGMDLYGEPVLPDLLEGLCRIRGIEWVRLLYCYPDGITEKLISTIKKEEKICNYIDMPIQHISDEVLKRMNRRTTGSDIENTVKRLKVEIPGLILRSTVIVGFPGETEEDFNCLLCFVKKGYFDRLGVFVYSREEDTPAYHMDRQISRETAEKRKDIIMKEQQKISLLKNALMVGRSERVLVEGKEEKYYFGRTYGDAPEIDNQVLFQSASPLKAGEFVTVKLEHAFEYDVIGSVLK
ncbi:MAG: 30S ribosomal protein S12 methylthiotransferase RimO [Bacillota bacterium]|nr:30S ribosomal protein S12 methylthiotransferase RimO [Bacillota bacterium]